MERRIVVITNFWDLIIKEVRAFINEEGGPLTQLVHPSYYSDYYSS